MLPSVESSVVRHAGEMTSTSGDKFSCHTDACDKRGVTVAERDSFIQKFTEEQSCIFLVCYEQFFVARGRPERPPLALRRLTARRSREQGLLRPCGHVRTRVLILLQRLSFHLLPMSC